MKKLDEIRQICNEAIDELAQLQLEPDDVDYEIEQGRAELAEEILEILNGDNR